MYTEEHTNGRNGGNRRFEESERFGAERDEMARKEFYRRNGRRPPPPLVDEVAGSEFM